MLQDPGDVMRLVKVTLWVLVVLGLITGCSSPVPIWIRVPPTDNPSLGEIRMNEDRYRDKVVRWGGTIAAVRNLESETEVEVVERTLTGEGRPDERSTSEGRFLARIEGFLDPAVYTKGRAFTVRGKLAGEDRRKIGDYLYHYPVLRAKHFYLWEPLPMRRPYRDPWLRDPWRRDPYFNDAAPHWW